jgi:hypothetical protein
VTTPPRYNQWYSFGGATGTLYYRVAGVTATTADYTSTFSQEPVTATNIGSFQPGLINFNSNGQGHTTDTEFWVYDAAFNPIVGYGNDDSSNALNGAPGTTSLQSFLTRNFLPGTYYLAVSQANMALNLTSPSDDNFRTGNIMDFPGILASAGTSTNANMTFAVTDSSGGPAVVVQNTKIAQFDANFFVFTVVPEPATAGLFALAAPMILRRRRD